QADLPAPTGVHMDSEYEFIRWNDDFQGEGGFVIEGYVPGFAVADGVEAGYLHHRTADPDTDWWDVSLAGWYGWASYRVAAMDANGFTGRWSSPISATWPDYPGSLPALQNVQTQAISTTEIRLTWDAVDGAEGYAIFDIEEPSI